MRAGLDSAASSGQMGRARSFTSLTTNAPASLPSHSLQFGLHSPPVHKILDHQYPVDDLVVPELSQAVAGGQAQ